MYVISPWSRGGWVNSQVFDHTSVILFLEQCFAVHEPNISPYRRAVCGDLTSAFDFKTPNHLALPQLSGTRSKVAADSIRREQSLLPQITYPIQQAYPTQATGIRPSRALPYILHSSVQLDADSKSLTLKFANTGQQAAVFHVYNQLNLEDIPYRYMVEAGKTLDDVIDIPELAYDLWILGPNGYHRHFKGHLGQEIQVDTLPEIRVCYAECSHDIYLKLRSDRAQKVKFNVQDNAYLGQRIWQVETSPDEQELHWDMHEFGGWYDFTVTLEQDPSYQRRFAGRIEIGQDSISDPLMGYRLANT